MLVCQPGQWGECPTDGGVTPGVDLVIGQIRRQRIDDHELQPVVDNPLRERGRSLGKPERLIVPARLLDEHLLLVGLGLLKPRYNDRCDGVFLGQDERAGWLSGHLADR